MKTIIDMTVGELIAAGHYVSVHAYGANIKMRLKLTDEQLVEAVQSLSLDGKANKGAHKGILGGAINKSRKGLIIYG